MPKYTPGPWEVDTSRLLASVNTAPMNQQHKHIAMANYFNSVEPETRVTEQECLANARLIAAAPELLEACKAALKLANEMSEGDLYDQIKNAITKAEGETNDN